jgi:hypothetical protein
VPPPKATVALERVENIRESNKNQKMKLKSKSRKEKETAVSTHYY